MVREQDQHREPKRPGARRLSSGADRPGVHHSSSGAEGLAHGSMIERLATWTIHVTGGRWGFFTALLVVIVWLITGPFFHFSELWQLVINTATTIVTFLMVFLIQNAQNRESKALQLKMDEVIYALKSANNEMISIESLTEEQLDRLAEHYHKVAESHQRLLNAEARGHAKAAELKIKEGGEEQQPSQ